MRIFRFCSLFLLLSTVVCGQSAFILPVKQKVYLTGNYAEIRPGHFHAGLDFKTDPKEHLPIYAVADGYISRIKVGTHGYGKVLYVTHSNGYVSVYGHQYAFADSIGQYVQAAQDKLETFEVELFPKPNELRVKQGQIIGYSGNTGDSGGPHLHFEIRNEKTEVPLNPLRFLNIFDTVAPTISSVSFYGFDYDKPDIHLLKDTADTLIIPKHFGVGVECFDLEQRGGNKNNVYRIELFLDGTKYYEHVLDSIPFDVAGYVNAYCHYMPIDKSRKRSIQKCFKGKNNELPVYKLIRGDGFVSIEDTLAHRIKVRVCDFYHHASEISYAVRAVKKPAIASQRKDSPRDCLKPQKKTTDDYVLEIPAKTFYTDLFLFDTLMTDSVKKGFYSGRRFVFDGAFGWYNNIPFQKACTLSLKADEKWLRYADRLCLVEGSGKNYVGGKLIDGYVTANIKKFGTYKIDADTTAPKIKFNKPARKKFYKNSDFISFTVTDDLSGVGAFKVFVNDKFRYAEYEHKSAIIFFEVNEKTPRDKIKVKIEVNDKKGNRSSLEVFVLVR